MFTQKLVHAKRVFEHENVLAIKLEKVLWPTYHAWLARRRLQVHLHAQGYIHVDVQCDLYVFAPDKNQVNDRLCFERLHKTFGHPNNWFARPKTFLDIHTTLIRFSVLDVQQFYLTVMVSVTTSASSRPQRRRRCRCGNEKEETVQEVHLQRSRVREVVGFIQRGTIGLCSR